MNVESRDNFISYCLLFEFIKCGINGIDMLYTFHIIDNH